MQVFQGKKREGDGEENSILFKNSRYRGIFQNKFEHNIADRHQPKGWLSSLAYLKAGANQLSVFWIRLADSMDTKTVNGINPKM